MPIYCSINSHALCENTFISLYPSRGGIGIRLKTANQKLSIEKVIQKFPTKSDSKSFCKGTENNAQYKKSTKIPKIHNIILLAGPANDVISSSL